MTKDVTQTAGAKLFIGEKAWAHDTLTEYDGQTTNWVEVGLVETIGDFGKRYQVGTVNVIGDKRTRKFKTTYDEGSLALTVVRKPADAGQDDVRLALDDPDDYPFKIELDDKPSGVGAKPTRFYFRALVASYTTNMGGTQDALKAAVELAINSDIVEGAAAAS